MIEGVDCVDVSVENVGVLWHCAEGDAISYLEVGQHGFVLYFHV